MGTRDSDTDDFPKMGQIDTGKWRVAVAPVFFFLFVLLLHYRTLRPPSPMKIEMLNDFGSFCHAMIGAGLASLASSLWPSGPGIGWVRDADGWRESRVES